MKTTTRLRALGAGLVLVTALGGLAACGSDSTADNKATPSTGDTSGSSVAPAGDTSTTPASTDSSASGTQDLTGKTIALLSCAPVVPFCANANKVFVDSLEARGATVRESTSNYDPAEQAQQLTQVLTQKVDAIALITFSQAALRPGLLQAKQQGIPVMFLGTPADPDIASAGLYTTYVGADDKATGGEQADLIVQGLQEEGKDSGNIVILNSTTGQTSADLGVEGFKEALANHPGYQVVGSGDTNYDPTKAGSLLTQLLNQNREAGVDAVWIPPGGALVAPAILAAQQAGYQVGVKNKGLVLVSKGCTAATNKLMRAGQLYGDSALTVPSFAKPGADVAAKLALGESVDQQVITPAPSFTVDDVDKYAADCALS